MIHFFNLGRLSISFRVMGLVAALLSMLLAALGLVSWWVVLLFVVASFEPMIHMKS